MKKKLRSWVNAIKVNNRAFLLISKEFPNIVLSNLISAIWHSFSPFVTIYLSALIIEELSLNRDINRIITLVLITLFSSVLIGLISSFLNKWSSNLTAGYWYRIEHIFTKKILSMDYITVDDAKTYEKLEAIHQIQWNSGWGLGRVLWTYENLISSIVTLIGGISLTVSLFMSKVPQENGGYQFLNSPLFIVLIIAVMLFVIWLSPALNVKANKYWHINMDEDMLENRKFSFYGFMALNTKKSADVRLYRQDLISDKINLDKNTYYGPKGTIAKLAKGKMGLLFIASEFVNVIFTGFVYAFVCLKAWAGAFGVGMVTQYVASVNKISSGAASFISTIGGIKNNAPFLEKIFEFLDMPNPMYQGTLTVEKRNDNKYEIEFKNVSFKYPGSEEYALKNVSVKLNVGNRFAMVGRNGSGKTTFIKLLCRLYDPTEGEILLNGIDIRKYNYLEYLNIFSVVFQDFELFSYKLGENVAGKTNYDHDKVIDSLQKVGFEERLKSLEQGVETYLYKDYESFGVDISGGEAQKIALARASYKHAPFTILDEPTASLDPLAEAEIYSKFDEIARDTTTVYISHRLSSCRFCDEIIVFNEGCIVQKGTHSELVKDENGKYYELWNAQAQYYSS